MSTVVLYCWCHSDGASVLLYFTFYTQKVAYFVFKDSSTPVKASSFNPLNTDLLTLYRRPWPTYAVPPTTTLYPRSTYDMWRAGSSPTILQPDEKLIPLTTTSQSGPDQSRCIFDQHGILTSLIFINSISKNRSSSIENCKLSRGMFSKLSTVV